MTDLEQRLRRGLHSLAQPIAWQAPTPILREHTRTGRRNRVAVAVALAVALTTSAAAATGLLPDPVRRMVQTSTSWAPYGVDPDDAGLVATTDDGATTWELWVADGSSGGRCEHLIKRVGEARSEQSAACYMPGVAPSRHDLPIFGTRDGHQVIAGLAPDGTDHVVVTDQAGTHLLHVARDGYFLVVVASSGRLAIHLAAVASDGRTLLERDW
jgi:hypothetical protein